MPLKNTHLRRIFPILCVMALLVCAVQATTTLEITVVDEDGDEIEGAYIYIDDDYEGQTDDDGEYEFDHSLDDTFELKVIKSGYDTWEDDIDEDEDSVTVELEESIEEFDLTIYVYDADTLQPISGAEVAIESEDGDTDDDDTDSSGMVTFEVNEETDYEIDVRDDDYVASITEVEIEDEDESVRIWLVSEDRVAFKVRDADTRLSIDGAEVTVDGDSKGLTGSGGVLYAQISSGTTHSVSVACDGYETYAASITLEDTSVYQIIELTDATSYLTITVADGHGNPLSGATVYIDGDKVGTTDSGGEYYNPAMIEGTYTVTVSRDDYEEWEETRTIGDTTTISVTLPVIETEVTVIVEDTDHKGVEGAIVTLDGEEIGITGATGELDIDLESGSDYGIGAQRDGYNNASTVLDLNAGERLKTVTLTLESDSNVGSAGLIILSVVVIIVGVVGARRLFRNRGGSLGRGGVL